MIRESELPSLIYAKFPAVDYPVTPVHTGLETYVILLGFTQYTHRAVNNHDLRLARHCFLSVAEWYRDGDKQLRSLLENIFVYDIGTMFGDHASENNIIKDLIPSQLYDIYLKQVMSSGC